MPSDGGVWGGGVCVCVCGGECEHTEETVRAMCSEHRRDAVTALPTPQR